MSLTAVSVSKTYAAGGLRSLSTEALSGISLEILEGTFTLVLGPAGSGKSTLLALLAGVLPPTAGEIRWNGMGLARAGDGALANYRKRCVGYIPQEPVLIEELTLLENVVAPNVFLDMGMRELKNRAYELIDRLGLRAKAGLRPSELSGDEKKAAMTARALLKDPLFLLADEPVAALNNGTAAVVLALFSELCEKGSAVVAASRAPLNLRPAPTAYKLLGGRIVEIRRGR